MDAGAYNFAIAFQERIKISDEKMQFYEVCKTFGVSVKTYVGVNVSNGCCIIKATLWLFEGVCVHVKIWICYTPSGEV